MLIVALIILFMAASILFLFFAGMSVELTMMFLNQANHFLDNVLDISVILKRRISNRFSEST